MNNGFWRSVLSVLSGTMVAQAIPILGSLLLARIYFPAAFGTFAAWLGIVLFLAVALTGRFETALAIESDGEPRRIAVISTLLTVLLSASVCLFILASLLLMKVGWITGIPLMFVLTAIPTAVLASLSDTWQSWAAAEGHYRSLSIIRISQSIGIVLCQILAGLLFPTASALVVGQMFGLVVGVTTCFIRLPIGKWPGQEMPNLLLDFWRRNIRFPLFSLPSDTMNTAVAQLPLIVIAVRFNTEIAGLLALTMRVLGAPLGLLGKSVLDVFKRHASKSFREKGECRGDYVRTFQVLCVASIVFAVFMYFVSEDIFAFLFGENWRDAGVIAIWLIPLFALRFMASPLSYVVYIVGKQHIDLFWQISLLATTLACLYLPTTYELVLKSYSWGYSLLYIVYLAMTYRLSGGVKK